MSKDVPPRVYSDGEILDLIEDFLVNHFGEDDKDPGDPNLFEMLTHICDLVELRSPKKDGRPRDPKPETSILPSQP